jgi:hypothetical protein
LFESTVDALEADFKEEKEKQARKHEEDLLAAESDAHAMFANLMDEARKY